MLFCLSARYDREINVFIKNINEEQLAHNNCSPFDSVFALITHNSSIVTAELAFYNPLYSIENDNGCAEIPDLFRVLNMISCLTREINLAFPSTRVFFCLL